MWFGAGTALSLLPHDLAPGLLLVPLLAAPIWTSRRPPRIRLAALGCALAFLAGGLGGWRWHVAAEGDCLESVADGAELELEGRFQGLPARGRAPFLVERGLGEGCGGAVRALVRESPGPGVTGRAVRVRGTWLAPSPGRPARTAGLLAIRQVEPADSGSVGPGSLHLVVRGRVQERLRELFGGTAPMAEALVLARKEGLEPELKEAFALSGLAHLLAISGFHVGVVAGLLFGALRLAGVPRSRAGLLAAGGCWLYVLGIGVPHAAARAATILTLLALGRLRGRKVAPAGSLASAFLLLALLEPGALLSPGFQLSFAGAGGLVFLRPGLARVLAGGPRGAALPAWLRTGLASGTAATLATLPLVAWHFDRVSLVGIPATLAVAPVVALAIPGIGLTLAVSWVSGGLAGFLAGGVGLLLAGTARGAELVGGLPWAALWVSRPALLWAVGGVVGGLVALEAAWRVSGRLRRTVLTASGVAGVVLGPVLASLGGGDVLEMAFLDVGQGDGIAIRSPGGRWVVVDAGPASETFDAGERVVLPYLRRRGAGRVEVLFLTHPHLDHFGGAGAVLRELPVGAVSDPGVPTGSASYVELLAGAREAGVRWWAVRAGETLEIDGMELRVLHPFPGRAYEETDPNDVSVVLVVRFGAFRALLTGDAPASVEEAVLMKFPPGDVDLLKVGHHGSSTSTGSLLLERVRPEGAVISSGRRNRFGHPHGAVLRRLEEHGVRIFRTDRRGTILIRARRDGTWIAGSG